MLAEEVAHPVAREETVLFAALVRSGVDQVALGQRMRVRRTQLETDLASPPPAIDGTEPRGLLRGALDQLRERRARQR